MSTKLYKVQFFSYWHTSSGLSAGTDASTVVIKDKNDLPFIPGKTLKGLLREAAFYLNELNAVSTDFLQEVFGVGDDEKDKYEKRDSIKDLCYFSNAELSTKVAKHILAQQQQQHLYQKISSTKIDANGLAVDKTLRTIEIAIPLTFYAAIEDFPDKTDFEKQLIYCFKWVKRLGLNRNRGLGRCEVSLISQ